MELSPTTSPGAQEARSPKFLWQCQASHDESWTDYSEVDTALLESSWTIQLWSSTEIAISLEGWPGYTFHLGQRLQQVNDSTGTARTIRRIILLEQGLPGGYAEDQLDGQQQDQEDEDSQESFGY
jgi:hypothetical protein